MKFFYKTFLSFNLSLILLFVLCIPTNLNIINASEKKRYCDTYYTDGGTATYVVETLSYDYYTNTQMVFTTLEPPKYSPYSGQNSCAPTAGAIAIGYYDFYYSNLVPNYDTYYSSDGDWYPKGISTEIVNLESALYTAMGTNVGGDGTTVSGFLNGLSSYVSNQNYSLTYTNMGSSTTLVNNCITAFNNDQIVVLFLDSYEYIDYALFHLQTTSYTFTVKTKQAGHVVIATGYHQYKFYRNNQLIETDNYFEVSFGDGTWGLLKANSLSSIDAAYKLSIS